MQWSYNPGAWRQLCWPTSYLTLSGVWACLDGGRESGGALTVRDGLQARHHHLRSVLQPRPPRQPLLTPPGTRSGTVQHQHAALEMLQQLPSRHEELKRAAMRHHTHHQNSQEGGTAHVLIASSGQPASELEHAADIEEHEKEMHRSADSKISWWLGSVGATRFMRRAGRPSAPGRASTDTKVR